MSNPITIIGHRFLGGTLAAAALIASTASAQLQVITVPWRGDPTLAHTTISGVAVNLTGVAIPAAGCTITAASWDPGDGSGAVAIPFNNPRDLELSHVYTGGTNQPFVATLSVTDSCGTTVADTFRVTIQAQALDPEVDMAIDRALWRMHLNQQLSSVGAIPTGYWTSGATPAATASCVQAMEIHGHRPTGNGAEDPYVEDVTRGLAHLTTELSVVALSVQPAGDPDTNGNGIGLEVLNGGRPIYVGGQVVDALVASGTPAAVAVTGVNPGVLGRRYDEIVQDLMDTYFWGQSDGAVWSRGGWRYGWNQDADNSACQWMAIGGIAAERVFGTIIPQWVKDENQNYWIPYSQFLDGSFTSWDGSLGYAGQISIVDVAMMNTTPSGIVQLDLNNVPTTDPRFVAAQAYMARNWTTLTLNNRIYGMFATAKSMRLAVPLPVHTLTSPGISFDWYRAQTALGDPVDGLARRLVSIQQGDGSWDGYWVIDDLATAWATIILSSSIVQLGPVAVCDTHPSQTAATFPVSFDGSASYHQDPTHSIVNYEWDFEGDGIFDATGVGVIHAYPNTGVYNATLRVTDDTLPVPLQSTSVCVVQITPPPFPPDADAGGPYHVCTQFQPWILDGSASSDPDGSVVSYEWDFNPQPLDLSFNDATGPMVDVTAFFSALGPGVYDIALRVTDNNTLTNVDFTTFEVLAPGQPCVGQTPVLHCPPDFSEIWNGGVATGQTLSSHTGVATYTDSCAQNVNLTEQDISVVPNTITNPGAPELVITRRWTLTDGCGTNMSCDQIITLLSPSGQGGLLMADVRPNQCPNIVGPGTGDIAITIPGTWNENVMDINVASIRIHRADGEGKVLKYAKHLFGPTYADVTRPYYQQNGPCSAQGPDGHPDLTLHISSRAMRALLGLHSLPDNTLVNLVISGKKLNGESFSLTDWITTTSH